MLKALHPDSDLVIEDSKIDSHNTSVVPSLTYKETALALNKTQGVGQLVGRQRIEQR
jgi:hypothetical protein